jgi:pimeloyl-ACP methyl ester carboxylesterase
MGGMITCSILGTHPERFRSAVIGGAGWFPPQEDPVPAVRKRLAESLEQGKGIEPLILSLIPEGDPPPSAGQLAVANKMFLATNDALALAALQRNSPPPPTETQLRAVGIPVLALVGEKDARKVGADNLTGLLPQMKVVVIPGANHVTAPLSPGFKKSLRAFLDEHSAARKAEPPGPTEHWESPLK